MHVPLHVLLIRAFDELEALLSLFCRTKILSHRFSLTLLCGEILHEGTQLRVALHKSYVLFAGLTAGANYRMKYGLV